MDICQRILVFLSKFTKAQQWPEMQTILTSTVGQKPRHWQLLVQASLTVAGNIDQAFPGVAAIACLHISIILIDDLLDEDPRGAHLQLGRAATANLSAAFAAIGLQVLTQSKSPAGCKTEALRALTGMMATTAFGQYLDTRNYTDEDSYWRVVQTKSSPFFGTALYVGALLGGAPLEVASQIKQFGKLYGTMIQIHDDLNDVLEVPANSDWVLKRTPLPILFAQLVHHPEQERFLALRQALTTPEALLEAQTILIRCGAISYAVDQLLAHYEYAQNLLAAIPGIRKQILKNALAGIIAPIQHLLTSVGLDQSNALLEMRSLVNSETVEAETNPIC